MENKTPYEQFFLARKDDEMDFPDYTGECITGVLRAIAFKGEKVTDFMFEVEENEVSNEELVKFTVKAIRKGVS